MGKNWGAARLALLGVLLCGAYAYATAGSRAPVPPEAEESAAAARAALARLPAEARLEEIGDARLRRAVQATYRAVVELAENRDAGKVAALNTRFERAYAAVGREAGQGEHRACAANCRALDGEPCRAGCRADRRKFCGCNLIVFGCVVAECIF